MVVALLFRHHKWISVAALGSAMTYAAVSAIHAIVIVAISLRSEEKGIAEIDAAGILPILTIEIIMLAPILNWSDTMKLYK